MKGAIIHTTLVEKTNACFVSNNNSKYVYIQLYCIQSTDARALKACVEQVRQQPRQCINWVFGVETKKQTKYFLNNNSNRLLRYKFYPKRYTSQPRFECDLLLSLSLIFSYYRLFLVRISLISLISSFCQINLIWKMNSIKP